MFHKFLPFVFQSPLSAFSVPKNKEVKDTLPAHEKTNPSDTFSPYMKSETALNINSTAISQPQNQLNIPQPEQMMPSYTKGNYISFSDRNTSLKTNFFEVNHGLLTLRIVGLPPIPFSGPAAMMYWNTWYRLAAANQLMGRMIPEVNPSVVKPTAVLVNQHDYSKV